MVFNPAAGLKGADAERGMNGSRFAIDGRAARKALAVPWKGGSQMYVAVPDDMVQACFPPAVLLRLLPLNNVSNH
jgi:hypothetical protein